MFAYDCSSTKGAYHAPLKLERDGLPGLLQLGRLDAGPDVADVELCRRLERVTSRTEFPLAQVAQAQGVVGGRLLDLLAGEQLPRIC